MVVDIGCFIVSKFRAGLHIARACMAITFMLARGTNMMISAARWLCTHRTSSGDLAGGAMHASDLAKEGEREHFENLALNERRDQRLLQGEEDSRGMGHMARTKYCSCMHARARSQQESTAGTWTRKEPWG